MQPFAQLFQQLDEQRGTKAKVAAMTDYFASTPAADGAWAVYFLSGRRLKRLIGPVQLRQWLAQASGLPLWLIEQTHEHVGDLAETVALVLSDQRPRRTTRADGLADWVETHILSLRGLEDEQRREQVINAWQSVTAGERLIYTKLLTGALRIGVSQTLVERALAKASAQPQPVIAHRLMGHWEPNAEFFQGLFAQRSGQEDASRPFPFFSPIPLIPTH
jgi:DNA ligase N terminus.